MKIDLSKVCDVVLANVKAWDYPDFCDAYIESGGIEITREEYNLCKGNNQVFHNGKYYRDLTDEEINFLNAYYTEYISKLALDNFH